MYVFHPHERQHFDALAPGETMTIVRAMVPQPETDIAWKCPIRGWMCEVGCGGRVRSLISPHQPNERVGVGEEHWGGFRGDELAVATIDRGEAWEYTTANPCIPDAIRMCLRWKKQPASTLPEWAIRQWVTVVGVDGKRVQDIHADMHVYPDRYGWYNPPSWSDWWNKHNPTLPFDGNPWVWVETIRKEGA